MTVENRSHILQGDWGIGRLCGGRLRFRLPCDRAVRARLLLMPFENIREAISWSPRIRVNTWHAVNLSLFMFRVLDLVSGNVKLRELSSQSRGDIHSTLVTLLILYNWIVRDGESCDDGTAEAGIAHPPGTESGRIRVRPLRKCNNLPTVLWCFPIAAAAAEKWSLWRRRQRADDGHGAIQSYCGSERQGDEDKRTNSQSVGYRGQVSFLGGGVTPDVVSFELDVHFNGPSNMCDDVIGVVNVQWSSVYKKYTPPSISRYWLWTLMYPELQCSTLILDLPSSSIVLVHGWQPWLRH